VDRIVRVANPHRTADYFMLVGLVREGLGLAFPCLAGSKVGGARLIHCGIVERRSSGNRRRRDELALATPGSRVTEKGPRERAFS
jgi:hypothetical protein